jgi:phage-related protein
MPRTDVVFYQEDPEDVPVLNWLKELRRTDQRAYESCVAAVGRLAELRKGRVNFRILYFFHGNNVAILGHALTKEDKVPKGDIEKAIRRKRAFEINPAAHSYLDEDTR